MTDSSRRLLEGDEGFRSFAERCEPPEPGDNARLREVATEARDALACIVVMLGTGTGDPMGTARRHFEVLDDVLGDDDE